MEVIRKGGLRDHSQGEWLSDCVKSGGFIETHKEGKEPDGLILDVEKWWKQVYKWQWPKGDCKYRGFPEKGETAEGSKGGEMSIRYPPAKALRRHCLLDGTRTHLSGLKGPPHPRPTCLVLPSFCLHSGRPSSSGGPALTVQPHHLACPHVLGAVFPDGFPCLAPQPHSLLWGLLAMDAWSPSSGHTAAPPQMPHDLNSLFHSSLPVHP